MGGFLGVLKDVGEGIAQQSSFGQAIAGALDPSFQPAQKNQQNLLSSLINRYKPAVKSQGVSNYYSNANGAVTPTDFDSDVPGIDPAHLTDPSNPVDPNRYMAPAAQQDISGDIPNQNQWQSAPGGGVGQGIRTAAEAAVGLADGSTLVTKPTIAKIGERGPEMVVPLQARAGNRVQPDVLEGHIQAPKVPGIKYSRYKSFTDRAL